MAATIGRGFGRVGLVFMLAFALVGALLAEGEVRAAPSVTDLSILDIEVTQGTQCLDTSDGFTNCPDNTLELTTGRPVAVRVYVAHDGPQCPAGSPFDIAAAQVTVTLRWIASHTGSIVGHVPDELEKTFDVPCSQDLTKLRADAKGSSTFILPVDRLGSATKENLLWIEAEVSSNQVQDTNPGNDVHELQLGGKDDQGNDLRGGLFPREALTVAWIPAYYWPDLSVKFPHDPYSGSPNPEGYPVYDKIAAAAAKMKAMFPRPVEYVRAPGVFPWVSNINNPNSYKFLCEPGKCPDLRDAGAKDLFLDRIGDFLNLMKPKPDSLVVWIPSEVLGCSSKAEGYGGAYHSVCASAAQTEEILAHEVGHTLWIWHTDELPPKGEECWPFPEDSDIREAGFSFWANPPGPVPGTASDFMDSGPTNGSGWVSPYLWNVLLEQDYSHEWAKVGSGCADAATSSSSPQASNVPAQSARLTTATPQLAALVSGSVPTDGPAVLRPLFQFDSGGPFSEPNPAGAYCLDFRNSTGVLLGSHCFDLPRQQAVNGPAELGTGFSHLLPLPSSTGQIDLRQGSTVLVSRVASAHAPAVSITKPTGGGVMAGSIEVSWTGADADGDALEYALLYSPDGGASFFPLAVRTVASSGELDSAELPGGSNAVLRLLASDGFHTTIVESPAFEVTRKPPRPVILAPTDGSVLDLTADVVLVGAADDAEDGNLTGAALTWQSDRDGLLGTGEFLVLNVPSLSPGEHLITLSATDRDGNTATISVTLIGNRPPVAEGGEHQTVEATSPQGAAVFLDGSGSFDPDGDPLGYRWTEDNTEIATGVNPEVTMGLGVHTIVLTVTDSYGVSDTDEVEIGVADTTPPSLAVTVSPDTLWPPNHKYVEVTVTIDVSDIVATAPAVRLVSVSSSEPDDSLGDGDMPDDVVIVDDVTVLLRAERSGQGEGRIYTLTYQAVDDSGNTTETTATVMVPHSNRKAVIESSSMFRVGLVVAGEGANRAR